MNVIFGLEQLAPPLSRSVLTVGNFDGVHVGHQEILRRARELAAEGGHPVAALTFDPHPLAIVAPTKAPECLMSISERVRRLGESGADVVVVARSAPTLLAMEAERFVSDVLITHFHPVHMVEGPTFGFGQGRKGTPEALREWVRPSGCALHVVPPVTMSGTDGEILTVSSSLIRSLLRSGEVERAALCLGRPYAIEAEVVHGAARGRTIGFPSANFRTPAGQVEPAEGVYAGSTHIGVSQYACAISVGRAETFGASGRQLETHLLGFQGDLYGRTLRVEFRRRIRDQRKFAAPEELIRQIQRDIEDVRRMLSDAKLAAAKT